MAFGADNAHLDKRYPIHNFSHQIRLHLRFELAKPIVTKYLYEQQNISMHCSTVNAIELVLHLRNQYKKESAK